MARENYYIQQLCTARSEAAISGVLPCKPALPSSAQFTLALWLIIYCAFLRRAAHRTRREPNEPKALAINLSKKNTFLQAKGTLQGQAILFMPLWHFIFHVTLSFYSSSSRTAGFEDHTRSPPIAVTIKTAPRIGTARSPPPFTKPSRSSWAPAMEMELDASNPEGEMALRSVVLGALLSKRVE